MRGDSDDRIQVLGDDSAVAFAGSQGNFELNAMRPVIINNFLHSAQILADGMEKFRTFSVCGTELNQDKITHYVNESLMLVTALSPVIGYQNAAHIAEAALAKGQTLKEAALASGHVDEHTFDSVVDPLFDGRRRSGRSLIRRSALHLQIAFFGRKSTCGHRSTDQRWGRVPLFSDDMTIRSLQFRQFDQRRWRSNPGVSHPAPRSSDQPFSITTGCGPKLPVGPPTRFRSTLRRTAEGRASIAYKPCGRAA